MTFWPVDCRVVDRRQLAWAEREARGRQPFGQRLVERRHAVVVEPRGDRPVHRHLVHRGRELLAVALVLLAHVAHRVGGALAVELVDRDEVGEIEHVDLFQLRCGAELRRHHVQRDVDQRHDRRVALADPRRLDDDQVEARDLARGDHVGQRLADFLAGLARRQRAHVDVRVLDRIHPDAVAQERAAGLAPGRVDRHDGELQPVGLIEAEAADQLVGERALAGAAGAGDAQRGHLGLRRRREQRVARLGRHGAGLEAADHPGERTHAGVAVAAGQCGEIGGQVVREIDVAGGDDLVDHPLQAELLAVLGREDPGHAIVVQLVDLGGDDHAAAAAEHPDVGRAALAQEVQHVLEELDVAALVRRDRDPVGVFLQRAVDDLLDRAVVTQVDHFAAGRLQDAAHDVDRGVVTVEQARRGDEADLVDRLVDERRSARVVHGRLPRADLRQRRFRSGGRDQNARLLHAPRWRESFPLPAPGRQPHLI